MMVTQSTGPRTDAGKMISSRNALRHGLLSQSVVGPRESVNDWEEFREHIITSLHPDAAIEWALADRIASLLWRLRRVPPAESEAIEHAAAEEAYEDERRDRMSFVHRPGPPLAGLTMIPPPAMLDRISRYETHLHRQLMQSLHELEAIQGRRNGHPSPLARLDITGDMPENPKTAKRTPLVESETDGVEPIFDANALDERDDSPADEVAGLLPPVQAVSVISEEHATMTTPATRDEIIEQNGVLVGPYRAPRNLAANERGSIHDDSVATKLGFRGGTVAGSIHMEQFPPLLVHAFGERWFETGSLSCYFRNATLHEERVRPLMQKPSATSNEQVNVWMERDDGMQVLEGTASVGTPPEPSMLRRKLAEPREAGELRILAHLTAGQQLDAVPSRLDFDALTKRRLEALTEPMPWYRAASSADAPSPWGAPIVNPGLLVHMMVQIQPSMRLRERAVGLYGAIETRHINGPVFMERDYEVSGKVLALGTTPKTEYVWYETLMRDPDGRDIASMLMMLRFMKASSNLWAEG